jgi:GNAT superfamily N-acetyltransferase
LKFRKATVEDAALLGELNHQLIQDEGHDNPMTAPQLARRMRGWLTGEYRAIIFEDEQGLGGYALYEEEESEVYLRHFFVARSRRRQGVGREAINHLISRVWPANRRLTVSVLARNQGALAFWKATGYSEYSLTLEIRPPSTRQS